MRQSFTQPIRSLQNRNYRLYFIGQLCSVSGTNAQVIAFGWLVLELTKSGATLGVVLALLSIPFLLLGPVVGRIVDRFPRRPFICSIMATSSFMAALLGTLVVTDLVQIWMIMVIAFVCGCLNAFEFPSRQSIVREIVHKDHVSNAIALNIGIFGIGRVVGPLIAAVTILVSGLAACFFVNSVSFMIFIFLISKMRAADFAVVATPVKYGKNAFRQALAFIRETPSVRATMAVMFVMSVLTYEFWVTVPLLVKETFHSTASTYGVMIAAMSVGTVIGSLIAANKLKVERSHFQFGILSFGLSNALVALTPNIVLAGFALVVMGICSSLFVSYASATLQNHLEPAFQSRVLGVWNMVFPGSATFGGPIVGFVSGTHGARAGLLLGTLGSFLALSLVPLLWGKESEAEGEEETKTENLVNSR